jgi:methyl-accepting chemotaxis protein
MQTLNAIRKLNIGLRMAIGYGFIFLTTILGFYYIIIKMDKMAQNSDNFYNHPYTVSNAINAAEIDVLTINRNTLLICLEIDKDEINKAFVHIDSIETALDESLQVVADQYLGPKSDIEHIHKLIVEWKPLREKINELVLAGKNDEALSLLKTKVNPTVSRIISEIMVVKVFAAKKAISFVELTKKENKSGFMSLYILISIMALLSLLTAYIITISILYPIRNLITVSKSISEGNLDNTIEVNQQDEIGLLSESFRKMQTGLAQKAYQADEIAEGNLNLTIELLSEKDQMGLAFRRMAEKLRMHLGQIEYGINVLSSSSSEITAAISQLAATSVETVTSVSETATTVSEVRQTAEHVNAKAQEVSSAAVKTSNFSKDGIKAVENSIDGMDTIREHMELIARTVIQLNEQSLVISDITSTVMELAEQSNLLSVNAAIEAAKAGEHGKGFSVVAKEIKSLANRSKEAANQVKIILRDVQKSINEAVTATDEGTKAVKGGLKLSTISGESISILSDSLNDAVNSAVQIAASSRQQLEGMDQISSAMENIKESTIQASSSTKQTLDSVREIQSIGENLKELINQYNIK